MKLNWWVLGTCLLALVLFSAATADPGTPLDETVSFTGNWQRTWDLDAGDALSISVGIDSLGDLPANGALRVEWTGPALADLQFDGARGDLGVSPSTGWSKTLHALDPDVYLVYQAPVAGTYTLALSDPGGSQPASPYARDTGLAPQATPAPHWQSTGEIGVSIDIEPIAELRADGIILEAEPNNTPEQAIPVEFNGAGSEQILRVIGGHDEMEYFHNAAPGSAGDDWYEIRYTGTEPKFISANLQLAEPTVSARLRIYQPGHPSPEDLAPRELPARKDFGNQKPIPYVHPPAEVIPGPIPIYSYYEGRDLNERIHQQDDNFRSFLTRELEPGKTYYLRVEANQPGYELELRVFDPAPYDDPVDAVRQGIYYQLAEVDAWLIHRPRNIAQHRRVRDGSNVMGENCMSCHTQSGVWGVADAFRNGYRPQGTVQNHRRLINTMYESLRPTNKLIDAAVNTSLAPLDLGDAPAGSRVAGRNIVLHERTFDPKKLHAHQQIRTANYVLQTADPKGINAAGKGSNFGPNVVFKFAAEILDRAWKDTGDEKYFWGVEEKGKKIVATGTKQLKVTDDLGHRIEFWYTLWPSDYPQRIRDLTGDDKRYQEAKAFHKEFQARVRADLAHLLELQQESGGWGFDLGASPDGGQSWTRMDDEPDPAATSVALIALRSAGYTPKDEPVRRGVEWLLGNQYPYGLWNIAAQTGFVTTAYALRALSPMFPVEPETFSRKEFIAPENESRLAAIARVRRIQTTSDRQFGDLMIAATRSEWPRVRYYGYLGIGGALAPDGLGALISGLDDPVKTCREAAFWSLRQLLLDGHGWRQTLDAYEAGSPRARQAAIQALVSRADLARAGRQDLVASLGVTLSHALADPAPGVRAFASKAAWRWWVWNPGIREPLNEAWVAALQRPEPSALAEMARRYSTASLLMVNGHIANQTGGENEDHQYSELADFYTLAEKARQSASASERAHLDRRLTAVAASHFQERGGDGGPGQMGYSTPHAAKVIGASILATYQREDDIQWKKIALQAAANVGHNPLVDHVLGLLRTDKLDLVATAAHAMSNPRSMTLPARVDTLEPLLQNIERFLASGRVKDARALGRFLARVKWSFEGVSPDEEKAFYQLLIPEQRAQASTRPARLGFVARPAPGAAVPDTSEQRHAILGDILGENTTLQRESVFPLVESGRRFWLPSTEWMVRYEAGGVSEQEALKGATQAEDLTVAEITSGRTTEQIVPSGLAAGDTILWWREGTPGGQLTFELNAPEAGMYEVIAAFLYDREMGIVRFSLNGADLGDPVDFYKPDLTPSGPVVLGVRELRAGTNELTVTMAGINPDAEPNYIFGLDYVKLAPDDGSGALFTKSKSGFTVIDPIVDAKKDVVGMFTSWFDPGAPADARESAVKMANKTALRRNPEVRAALADYIGHEKDPKLRQGIQNILNSDDKVYGAQLRKLIDARNWPPSSSARKLESTDDFVKDILHFRDYVFAEMTKNNEIDNRACVDCHGVPGRVPTLYIEPPDGAGYIAPEQLLANYREMQERVDVTDVERSKFLRKPLNIQDGEEDGHQGGARYKPEDKPYQVIRDWVLNQYQLQQTN